MTAASRFETGTIVVTPRAEGVLAEAGVPLAEFLRRHAEGDWTELNADQRALNEEGLRSGFNIVSHYRLPLGQRLMLVTLGDRSCTMVHVAPRSTATAGRENLVAESGVACAPASSV